MQDNSACRTFALRTCSSQIIARRNLPGVDVEGAVRPLHPIVRDEVYRIAGEAMRNAFQHSQSTHVGVELRYDKRQFCLRIRDKGKGIDTNVLAEWGREGHYGLRGMRERADLSSRG